MGHFEAHGAVGGNHHSNQFLMSACWPPPLFSGFLSSHVVFAELQLNRKKTAVAFQSKGWCSNMWLRMMCSRVSCDEGLTRTCPSPQVCVHYNKGSAPHGGCRFQDSCSKLHLCQHFLQGVCRFGPRCRRQHAVDQRSQSDLEQRELSRQLIRDLPAIYRNAQHLNAAAAASPAAAPAADDPDSGEFCKAAQTDQEEEICLHFIRNSCRFQDSCRQVHFHLPYKWEVYDGRCWSDLENMEQIERDYCNPAKTHSSDYQRVDFVTMTMESMPVRRLSTVSWVRRPPHYSLTTQWLWFCRAERGGWLEYGQPDEKQRSTSVASRTLEEAFVSGETEVQVVKGQRAYVVSFRDMYQRNHKHHTKRSVRRRPRFVSKAEVDKLVADLRKCSG